MYYSIFLVYHSFYSTWVQNTCKYYRTRKLFYSAQNTARSKSIMQCINVIGCESLEANWEWVSARLSFTNSLGILRSLKHLRVVVFFTARCTSGQSAVLRSHVVCLSVCPSVRPSVRLSVCNVGGL